MIKFSIITVCLNAGDDLLYTVTRSLNQTYDSFEIIVKDGFSKDGSVEGLPSDSRVKIVKREDSGIYDAMNQAIEEAQGEYLIFMNAGDAFYDDNVLEKLAEVISDKAAALFYGRCYNEALGVFSNSPQKLSSFFCYRSMICHQAMVFKADVIKNRKYDLSYRVSADRELMLYIAKKEQLKTQYVPVIIAAYQGSGFCETKANQERIANEDKRLKNEYFSAFERVLYSCAISLTMPRLRALIVKNPKLVKYYKRLISKLYRN